MADIYEVVGLDVELTDAASGGAVLAVLSDGHLVERLGPSEVAGVWRVAVQISRLRDEGYMEAASLIPVETRKSFRLPFFRDLKASYQRVSQFVGEKVAGQYGETLLPQLNAVLTQYGINRNARRFAHFMSQLSHESGGFKRLDENLNYSAEALWRLFRKYFRDEAEAASFARQPERIANRIYANRMGNGDEASGDGWRYRGRGFIQLTGRENYRRIGKKIGLDLEADPDLVARDVTVALKTAAAYWDDRGLNALADKDDCEAVTRKINGGVHGLKERKALLERARAIWS
jgi:putative chitinase